MKLSVIIPTYNEAAVISETLADLRRHQPDEIIVSDGGSADDTVRLAEAAGGVRVLSGAKGRAAQMNAGAAEAAGDVFLFLHADTRLPAGGISQIRSVIAEGREAGRFRLRFDDRRWLLRLFESYTRFSFFSYGDQGFFVTRRVFDALQGFRTDVPFEDVDFYKRLTRAARPVILKDAVVTSARRFVQTGSLKQKWINLFLMLLYYAGFNVLPIKEKLYPDVR